MHRWKRTRARVILAVIQIVLVSMLLGACAKSQPPATPGPAPGTEGVSGPKTGGVLRIIDLGGGGTAFGIPWETIGIDLNLVRPLCIETLMRLDTSGKVYPWLATGWEVAPDGKSITLKLRQGVKFHDGTDFNAEAVKYNLEKQIEAKRVSGWKSVEVIDEYTVRVNLEQYTNLIYTLLAGSAGMVASPTAIEKNGLEWARWHPVGTGPFKFESYQRDVSLKYKRFEQYWMKDRPYLDGVEFLFVKDPMAQKASLLAGEADVLLSNSPDIVAELKAAGLNVASVLIGPISLMPDSANSSSPLRDRRVREAIACAIDREAICQARGFGFWVPAQQLPNPKNLDYVPDWKGYQFDPEKAKRLLAEAGYAQGFKTRIIGMPGFADRDAMVAVQRYLGAVGIQADLDFPDATQYAQYRMKGWSNGLLWQHLRVPGFPGWSVNYYLSEISGQFPPTKRPEGPQGEKFQTLVEDMQATPEPSPEKTQKVVRLLAEDATMIPLYYISELYVLQPAVHDAGYGNWASTSNLWTPESAWLGK